MWFYNGKQVYGAWTGFDGTSHPANWDSTYTDAQKIAAGLVQTGTVNDRFFNSDGSKKTVATIKNEEGARVDGLKAAILGDSYADTISETDGEELETIAPSVVTKRAATNTSADTAKTLIAAQTTFDGLYDLIMRSTKLVNGINVPDATGNWGTDNLVTESVQPEPPFGIISKRAKKDEFYTG